MPIDDAQFKLAMSHFASGVTVVTTQFDAKPFGMTVASFASLSLHPPLVLVCIEKNIKTHEALVAAGGPRAGATPRLFPASRWKRWRW